MHARFCGLTFNYIPVKTLILSMSYDVMLVFPSTLVVIYNIITVYIDVNGNADNAAKLLICGNILVIG